MTYIAYKSLYPIMRLIEKFTYNDRDLTLHVNGRQLEIDEVNYDNAKLAMIYVIASNGNFVHEAVLNDPDVANPNYDIVYESIQAFLKQKMS